LPECIVCGLEFNEDEGFYCSDCEEFEKRKLGKREKREEGVYVNTIFSLGLGFFFVILPFR